MCIKSREWGAFTARNTGQGANIKQRPCKGVEDVGILNLFFLSFQDSGGTKRVKVRKLDHKTKLTKQHCPGPMLISHMVCQQTPRSPAHIWVFLGPLCPFRPARVLEGARSCQSTQQRATGKGELSHTSHTRA